VAPAFPEFSATLFFGTPPTTPVFHPSGSVSCKQKQLCDTVWKAGRCCTLRVACCMSQAGDNNRTAIEQPVNQDFQVGFRIELGQLLKQIY